MDETGVPAGFLGAELGGGDVRGRRGEGLLLLLSAQPGAGGRVEGAVLGEGHQIVVVGVPYLFTGGGGGLNTTVQEGL